MNINMFVTRDEPLRKLPVKVYSSDSTIPPDDYYRIIKGAEWKLFNNNFPTTSYGDKIYFVENGTSPLKKFEINNYKFILLDQNIILNTKEHNTILNHLVNSLIKQKAFSIGFARSEGQKYHNKKSYKEDFFSFYNAFYSEVEVLQDGKVGVWLDPTTKWKFKMSSFLTWAKNNNFSALNIYLLKKKVKYPSVSKYRSFTAKIVDIIDISIQEYKFEGQDGEPTSVYKYWTTSEPHRRWLQRNHVTLNPNDKPTLLLEISKNTKPLPYPPSVLEIVIDLLDPIIPDNVFLEKKSLSPKIRIQETFKLFDLILGDGLKLGNTELVFERKLFNLNDKSVNFGSQIYLNAPILQFGNGGICRPDKPWSDPDIKNAMFQYGPVDVKGSIPISYVAPESEIEHLKQFHNYLNKHTKKLHLGEFKLSNLFPVDRIHPDRYMRICQKFGQEITDQIAIVLLPKSNLMKTYFAAKRGLGRHLVKSEMIQWKTYNELLSASLKGGFSFSNYNIALKAYGRYLGCGEAIWHLKSPAGGLNPNQNNYFMGFDVSRNPETRKEAAAYAAVCDNLGRILYKNSIDTHRGEKIIAEVLSDWFFDLATSTYDDIEDNKKIDTIFLFKDGPIYPSERKEYQKGALLAKERLLQEHIMEKESDIKVIAAIKRGLHRFYGEEKYGYRVNYSGLIRNPHDAIIVTSKPRIGTASSTRLNLTYQINNNMNIEQIVRIFNDLRYLDWSSLFQQPKTILPLHIVQNLAKLTKEDIIVPYDPR